VYRVWQPKCEQPYPTEKKKKKKKNQKKKKKKKKKTVDRFDYGLAQQSDARATSDCAARAP
jgi:hypothetical protein